MALLRGFGRKFAIWTPLTCVTCLCFERGLILIHLKNLDFTIFILIHMFRLTFFVMVQSLPVQMLIFESKCMTPHHHHPPPHTPDSSKECIPASPALHNNTQAWYFLSSLLWLKGQQRLSGSLETGSSIRYNVARGLSAVK